MGDIEHRLSEVSTNYEKISRLSPDQMEAWNSFISLAEREGAISPRRKELIAVALSVYAKCDMSIARHVNRALRLGARRDEIMEAAWIAVLMGGDPVLMHARHVLKALEEFSEVEEEELIRLAQAQLAIDGEYKKLYYRLLDYVKCICNQTETICRGGAARRRLAINIAEADGSVLRRIVAQECERRGWKEPNIVSSPDGLGGDVGKWA